MSRAGEVRLPWMALSAQSEGWHGLGYYPPRRGTRGVEAGGLVGLYFVSR